MKVLVFALLALAVGANAFPSELSAPETREERIVANQINRAIDEAVEWLRANGLDPWQVLGHESTNTVQPGVVLWVKAKQVDFTGISWIDRVRIDYNLLTNRLRLHLVFPEILFSAVEILASLNYHGDVYAVELSGDFAMRRMSIEMDSRFNVGIISGISVRSMEIKFLIGSLWSNIRAVYQGKDYSEAVNNGINIKFPAWLRDNQAAIDRFLSEAVKQILDQILS